MTYCSRKRSLRRVLAVAAAAAAFTTAAQATTFRFETDPFEGSTALTTPGRQVVAGELFIPTFDLENDRIGFAPTVFEVDANIAQFTGFAADLPDQPFNFIVLQTLDFDGDPSKGNLMAFPIRRRVLPVLQFRPQPDPARLLHRPQFGGRRPQGHRAVPGPDWASRHRRACARRTPAGGGARAGNLVDDDRRLRPCRRRHAPRPQDRGGRLTPRPPDLGRRASRSRSPAWLKPPSRPRSAGAGCAGRRPCGSSC
jgi:hypothetical protein